MRHLLGASFLLALGACGSSVPPPAPPASTLPVAPAPLSGRDPSCAASHVEVEAGVAEPAPPATVAEPADPGRTCDVADSNLAAAEEEVLASAAAATASAPRIAGARWDHTRRPLYMDLVERRFHLTPDERRLLSKQGFAVAPDRGEGTYAWDFHELYQSQVPLYVSADAVFHAVYTSSDHLIEAIERTTLAPLLGRTLEAMACTLADAAPSYPPEIARDLDVYLTVARSLLADRALPGVLGGGAEASRLVDLARKPAGLEKVALFGRDRYVDFSAYTPRGHYAGDLAPFFRGAMWLSRLEYNLVSRSCRSSHPDVVPDPTETPREAVVALALADLADRAHVLEATDRLDRAWGLLAGKREDISISELGRLRKKAGIGAITLDAAAPLRAAIGDRYLRRARLHYMPEGASVLPAIATFLGPRIAPDATATRPLVHDEVAGRHMLHAADMAYALGHDRAMDYLQPDLARYPSLGKQLSIARGIVDEPLPDVDLYSAWFGAIRAVAAPLAGTAPSFMATPAYSDLRINTALAAYGQLRHNYVLIAGQGYDAAGCEIPDGYVEPLPDVYRGLIDYAERGARVMTELDPGDSLGARAYFARLSRTLRVLTAIAQGELQGRALTSAERRFLSMVAEYRPPGTGGGPTYTGWYFDLFRARETEGLSGASFIADYFTSSYSEQIAYVGARAPELGFFVIDTGGPARVMVGPVAAAYEHTGPLADRLTDEKALALGPSERFAPWSASYTAAPTVTPPLSIVQDWSDPAPVGDTTTPPPVTLLVTSTRSLGPVTIEILDHHRVALASRTLPVGVRPTKFRFAARKVRRGEEPPTVEGVHIKVGPIERVVTIGVSAMGPLPITAYLGGMKEPPEAP